MTYEVSKQYAQSDDTTLGYPVLKPHRGLCTALVYLVFDATGTL
jgi:hypothetical protein